MDDTSNSVLSTTNDWGYGLYYKEIRYNPCLDECNVIC